MLKYLRKLTETEAYKTLENFALIIPAAKTAMSRSLAALTMHVDPC